MVTDMEMGAKPISSDWAPIPCNSDSGKRANRTKNWKPNGSSTVLPIEYCLADRTVHRPRVLCSSTVVLSTMAKGKAGKALAGKAKCKVGKAMKGMKAGKAKGKAGKAKGKAGKAMKAGWKKVKACATQALDFGAELMKTSSMKEAKHLYWCVSLELLEIRREALRQLML